MDGPMGHFAQWPNRSKLSWWKFRHFSQMQACHKCHKIVWAKRCTVAQHIKALLDTSKSICGQVTIPLDCDWWILVVLKVVLKDLWMLVPSSK